MSAFFLSKNLNFFVSDKKSAFFAKKFIKRRYKKVRIDV